MFRMDACEVTSLADSLLGEGDWHELTVFVTSAFIIFSLLLRKNRAVISRSVYNDIQFVFAPC